MNDETITSELEAALFRQALARRQQAGAVHNYFEYHKARYDYVLSVAKRWCPDRSTRVLDIGRSYLSTMLLDLYDDVTTLGFPLQMTGHGNSDSSGTGRTLSGHIIYDLNDAQDLLPIDRDKQYDLIVFCETIEHLHTAPELVLFVLRGILRDGGIIICQTPNASSLDNRLLMMVGRNPFHMICIENFNPGHFREYTKSELMHLFEFAGYKVLSHEYKEYFGCEGSVAKLLCAKILKGVSAIFPSFSRGQTIVSRKQVFCDFGFRGRRLQSS